MPKADERCQKLMKDSTIIYIRLNMYGTRTELKFKNYGKKIITASRYKNLSIILRSSYLGLEMVAEKKEG